jgi:hypothetical protein
MDHAFQPEEAASLYSSLSPDEREELLQCLLIAASRGGGEAVMRCLEELMMCRGVEDLLRDQS